MTLEYLQNEMKTAMKTNSVLRRDVLRGVIAAIQKTAIDERKEADEAMVDRVLLKEVKTAQEQLDTCPETRVDLRIEYSSRLVILNEYAPQLMTNPEEIKNIVSTVLAAAGIEATKANRGVVMKAVMPHFKGKADMKIVNQVIGEMLV
jgi:uncharacterized protein YqeY